MTWRRNDLDYITSPLIHPVPWMSSSISTFTCSAIWSTSYIQLVNITCLMSAVKFAEPQSASLECSPRSVKLLLSEVKVPAMEATLINRSCNLRVKRRNSPPRENERTQWGRGRTQALRYYWSELLPEGWRLQGYNCPGISLFKVSAWAMALLVKRTL